MFRKGHLVGTRMVRRKYGPNTDQVASPLLLSIKLLQKEEKCANYGEIRRNTAK